jgi:YVTN family beta-propeller protein
MQRQMPGSVCDRTARPRNRIHGVAGLLCATFCLLIFTLVLSPQAAQAQSQMQIIAGSTAFPQGISPDGAIEGIQCPQINVAPLYSLPVPLCEAGYSGNGGPANVAQMYWPTAVAINSKTGYVYIADGHNGVIRVVDPSGNISLFAALPTILGSPIATALTVDAFGNVFYGDNYGNIYMNSPTAVLSLGPGFSIQALTADSKGNVYYLATVGLTFSAIGEIASNGNGVSGPIVQVEVGIGFDPLYGLAVDASGYIYTYDASNRSQYGGTIVKLDPNNFYAPSSYLYGGAGVAPSGLAVDPLGNLYILTNNGSTVQEYDPTSLNLTTIAGTGTDGFNNGNNPTSTDYTSIFNYYPYADNPSPPTSTDINQANNISLGQDGTLYIADTYNNLIRKVFNPAGTGCYECGPQSLTKTDTIPTGKFGSAWALNPVTHQLYVVNSLSNSVTVFSTAAGSTADTVLANISVGSAPSSIAVDSANNVIYVGNSIEANVLTPNGYALEYTVSAINATTYQVTTIPVAGSPLAIAVDPGLNKAYVSISNGAVVSVISGPVGGATPAPAAFLHDIPADFPNALTVDTLNHIVYIRVIAPNDIGGGNYSENYALAVYSTQTDSAVLDFQGMPEPIVHSISYGASTNIALDSIAVDESTGKVVVGDGFDQFVHTYFPSTQSFSFYDPGIYPFHVAVDSINGIYYFADGYGDTAYLDERAFTSGIITSTPIKVGDLANTCGSQGSVIGLDPTTDQAYITTCDGSGGAVLHLFDGSTKQVNAPLLVLGTPLYNGSLNGSFAILVDTSNTNPASHTAYIENSIINSGTTPPEAPGIDVINGPAPGARPSVTFSSNPLSFGIVQVNTPASVTLTVTNTGTGPLTTLVPALDDAQDPGSVSVSLVSPCLPLTTGSCTFNVTFTPTKLESFSGSITFTDNAPDSPQTVTLSGTGVAGSTTVLYTPLALNFGSPLNFGPVPEDVSASLSVTVTNLGTNPLAITKIGFATGSSTDFTENDNCQFGTQFVTGASCIINIAYTPTTSDTLNNSETATLVLTDNAQGSPNITLIGTSVDPKEGYGDLSSTSISFGNIELNEPSATHQISMEDGGGLGCGGAPLCGALVINSIAISGINGTNPADFPESDTCTGVNTTFGLPFSTCLINIFFRPSSTPQPSLELATLTISGTTINSQSQQVQVTETVALSGTSSLPLGPPALPLTAPELVSADNSVPPNVVNSGSGSIPPPSSAAPSSGGQYVAFSAGAVNLPGPYQSTFATPLSGVYLRNTCLGASSDCEQGTTFVAIGPGGGVCGGSSNYPGSQYPAIDTTGRFVAFESTQCPGSIAFNMVFLYDVVNQTSTLISSALALAGAEEAPFSMDPTAQYFAFESNPITLNSVTTPSQIYLTNACTGQQPPAGCTPSTALISQDYTNTGNPANYTAEEPSISANARYVAFASTATNLLNGLAVKIPTNPQGNPTGAGYEQVYLRDTCPAGATGCTGPITTLISLASPQVPSANPIPPNVNPNPANTSPSVSGDGRFVVFVSTDTVLLRASGANFQAGSSEPEIYLTDTCLSNGAQVTGCTQSTKLLSQFNGNAGNSTSSSPFISADGRLITFISNSSNLNSRTPTPAQATYEYDRCQSCATAGLNVLSTSSESSFGGGPAVVDASDQFATFGVTTLGQIGYPETQIYVGSTTVVAPPAVNTPASNPADTPVAVTPTDALTGESPVTLTFANVTSPGQTSVTLSSTGPALPNFQILGPNGSPIYLYLSTTAGYTGNITVCINLSVLDITYSSKMILLHFNANGQLESQLTLTQNGNQVCGTVTSLSPFALALPTTPLAIGPASLSAGTAGVAYSSVPFTATGGTGTVTVTETGTLPTGMTFTNGTLSGTPQHTGSYPITINASDSASDTGTENVALTVNCPTITVTPTALLNGASGAAYGPVQFAGTGGVGSLLFSATGLPSPLTLTTAGVLSGTPSQTGSFPLTVSATDTDACVGSENVTLTVTAQQQKTTPQITWANPAAITYGTALSATQLDATVNPNIAGTFVYSSPSGTVLTPGLYTLTVTFTPTDTTDYNPATGTVQLTVNTALLTVTANSASRAYGAANPSLAATVTGAVNGDTFTETVSTTATVTSGVGSYPITVSNVTGTNIADYSVTIINGALTVTAAPLTVTAGAASRAYGVANPTFTATVTGAVNGDTFTETLATTATVTSTVGSYPITVSNVTGTNIADYSVTSNNGTLTIAKATAALQLQAAVGTGLETLTATITPAGAGVPTGTVTFTYPLSGVSTTLGMVTLTSQTAPAVAVLSTSDLAFGSDTVTASYSGDANFNVITGTTVVTPNFTVAASITSITLSAGQSSPNITITATSSTGFATQLTLSCGTLPVYVHCLFTPVTIPATVPTSVTTATSTLVVSVDSTNAALAKEGRIAFASAAPLALLGLFSLLFGKRKRWILYAGMVLFFVGLAGTITGCASNSNSGPSLPPSGNQTVVVNATATGGIVQPLDLTVTISN